MAFYYVNKTPQANGDHEVHHRDCPHLSKVKDKLLLGDHTSCTSAVRRARLVYPTADGCKTCSEPCHHS